MTATASTTRSLLRKSLSALVLAGALASATLTGASSAQAGPHFFPHNHFHHGWGHHGWGPGAGIGLAIGALGAVAAYDAYGPRQVCHLERQFDDAGDYIGRVRVCQAVDY